MYRIENLHFQRRGYSKILSIADWLMLLLDSDVTMGHRFKLHLVYHSENPHAFKNILALYYQSSLTAWIPRALFKSPFQRLSSLFKCIFSSYVYVYNNHWPLVCVTHTCRTQYVHTSPYT